ECEGMGQISMKISALPGSVLSENQQFSLTKINWNSTQMNQRLPIPIRAARMVGEILKYVRDGQVESTDYRKYI
ncbi:hypothetical protein ACH0C8_15275, partial [Acetobacter lovaniensis]